MLMKTRFTATKERKPLSCSWRPECSSDHECEPCEDSKVQVDQGPVNQYLTQTQVDLGPDLNPYFYHHLLFVVMVETVL